MRKLTVDAGPIGGRLRGHVTRGYCFARSFCQREPGGGGGRVREEKKGGEGEAVDTVSRDPAFKDSLWLLKKQKS